MIAGKAEACDRLLDAGKAGLQSRIEQLAGRRERNRAYAPLEQFYAEEVLEAADLMAERARRHVQLLGRTGETQVAGRGLEGTQRVEWGHRALHEQI